MPTLHAGCYGRDVLGAAKLNSSARVISERLHTKGNIWAGS